MPSCAASGPITPPREFVFMDRAAIGLGSVFLHLKAEINWYRLFHELIDGFDVKAAGEAPGEGAEGGEAVKGTFYFPQKS